jgi:hypothetical protein
MRVVVQDVKECARCGNDHKLIEFAPFTNIGPMDGKWTHWGYCSRLAEPILLYVKEYNED